MENSTAAIDLAIINTTSVFEENEGEYWTLMGKALEGRTSSNGAFRGLHFSDANGLLLATLNCRRNRNHQRFTLRV